MDPGTEYERRLAARKSQVHVLEGRESLVANLRLLVFGIGLVTLWVAWKSPHVGFAWIIVPVAAFAALIIAHDRTLSALARARLAVSHYERCLKRVNDSWAGAGLPGDDLLPTDHPYAVDLDLFGRGSLFELLCTARTRAGEKKLADWLTHSANAETIRARQQAAAALRDRLDLREDLALFGSDINRGVLPDILIKWAESPPVFTSGGLRMAACCIGAYNICALIAWPIFETGPSFFLMGLIVAVLVERMSGNVSKHVIEALQEPSRELDVLALVLARLEKEPFEQGRLRNLQSALSDGGKSASRCIAQLHRLTTWHEARANQIFAIFALMLAWDVHFAYAFERWRTKHGGAVRGWLDALGELEALCALAAYHYERPADPFPEILDDCAVFDGVDIGHPLLATKECVRNTIKIDDKTRLYVVSGSNMSGKSTLLRTIGINAVMAFAGAPVRAQSLRISPMTIGATLRVQDSIQTGESRFYAEIRRLHQLAEIAKGEMPLLFLLDEILHGTNSHDRRIGADAVVRKFLEMGGIGLVTTHDLALTQTVDTLAPVAVNVHFEDHIQDGQLAFDYKMRAGVVEKSNALELMRRIGLDV